MLQKLFCPNQGLSQGPLSKQMMKRRRSLATPCRQGQRSATAMCRSSIRKPRFLSNTGEGFKQRPKKTKALKWRGSSNWFPARLPQDLCARKPSTDDQFHYYGLTNQALTIHFLMTASQTKPQRSISLERPHKPNAHKRLRYEGLSKKKPAWSIFLSKHAHNDQKTITKQL